MGIRCAVLCLCGLLAGSAGAQDAQIEAAAEPDLAEKKPAATAEAAPEAETEAPAAEPALSDEELEPLLPPSDIDQVTVHGQRRQDLLRERPEAITGFSADDLEMRSISNLSEIANSTPSLVLDRMAGSPNSARIYIRGIGQDDAISTADPGVGLYVDGVYMGRSFGALLDLFDLSTVDVLRGPQSRPFGRNAVGGAINLVSQLPSFDRDINGKLTLGTDGYRQGKLIADFPLIEGTLAGRLSLIGTRSKGYTENRLNDDYFDNEDLNAGRLSLQWTPSENLDLVTHFDLTHERAGSVGFEILDVHVRPDLRPLRPHPTYAPLIEGSIGAPVLTWAEGHPSAGEPSCVSLLDPNQTASALGQSLPDEIDDQIHSVEQNVPSRSDLDTSGATAIGTLQLPFAELRSITGWKSLEGAYNLDIDGTKYTGVTSTPRQDQWQFSQELQLSGEALDGRLEWLAGAFWFQEKIDDKGSLGLFSELSTEIRCLRSGIEATLNDIVNSILPIGWDVDFQDLRPTALDANGNLVDDYIPNNVNFNILRYGGLYNALTRAIAGCPFALTDAEGNPPCDAEEFFDASQTVNVIRDLQPETDVDTQNNTQNIAYSGYLWGKWNFDDRVSLSTGLRYSYDHKDVFRDSSFQPSGTPILQGVTASAHWTDWSPNVVLQYRYSDEWMGYLKVAKGYKPGGFNGRAVCPGNPLTTVDCPVEVAETLLSPYDPETNWTYELGLRTTWLDERLVLDGTLFYNLYTNRQINQLRFVGGEFQNDAVNVGRSVIQGFELEAVGIPWPELFVDLNFSLTNGRYLDFPDAIRNPELDPFDFNNPETIEALEELFGIEELISGENLSMPNLPMFKGSVGLTLERPLSEWGALRYWVGYRYQSRVFYNIENTMKQGAYGILDSRVSFEHEDGTWGAAIFAKNILDREYIQNGYDLRETIGFATVQWGRPRFVGVEIFSVY